MAAIVSLLRAVNLGSYNKIKMDTLREVYAKIGLRDAQSYVQSGNLVFRTDARDLARLRAKIEDAIEKEFGFHTDVILRSSTELGLIVKNNPFAKRTGVEPNRLLVHFLSSLPDAQTSERIAQIKGPEELHLRGSDLYIHYAAGVGRSKLTPAVLLRTLKTPGTARNWNTVTKLLEMAKALEHP